MPPMVRGIPALTIVVLLTLGTPGCGGCNNGAGLDASVDAELCGGERCEGGDVCRYDNCVPDPEPCIDDECPGDQWCDTTTNECLPWGLGPSGDHDETCSREAVPGVFVPGVQCEWLGPELGEPHQDHKNVLGSPMVADFGLNAGGGEFSSPYIVFIATNGVDGGAPTSQGTDPAIFGVIRVIDGKTCDLLYTIDTPSVISSPSVALGDLNLDGRPEIVAPRTIGGLAAWTYSEVTDSWTVLWETASTYADTMTDWTGPSIHDLDDDGQPEVMFYGNVYSGVDGSTLDETILDTALDRITGYIPVVADIDGDGQPELITGAQIYGWDIPTTAWVAEGPALSSPGRTAVADFGRFGADPLLDDRATLDGVGEVALVNGGTGTVRLWTITGRELFSAALPGGGAGGPPTVADFDGDGRVEIGVAGATAYSVFDFDCRPGGTPDVCPSGRTDFIAWSQQSQDSSSNVTGSSVFDFEGDGRAEVVYADECFTRVYDGVNGNVMYSNYRTSCTWYELPIIADVDGDFNAEIVVPSNANCGNPPGTGVVCGDGINPQLDPIFDGISCVDDSDCPGTTMCGYEQSTDALGRCRCALDADCGGGFVCRDPIAGPSAVGQVCRAEHPVDAPTSGVRVLNDSLDRWVNTRRIWNQHAYSVTNVNEDGTIPRTSEWVRNWTVDGLNTFRQNAPGAGIGDGLVATPDLTVRDGKVTCEGQAVTVTATVCNRGTEPVAPGVPISIYGADAAAACTAETMTVLFPGACEMVDCAYDAVDGPATIVADDEGSGSGQNTECREANNSFVVDVDCP